MVMIGVKPIIKPINESVEIECVSVRGVVIVISIMAVISIMTVISVMVMVMVVRREGKRE